LAEEEEDNKEYYSIIVYNKGGKRKEKKRKEKRKKKEKNEGEFLWSILYLGYQIFRVSREEERGSVPFFLSRSNSLDAFFLSAFF